MSMNTLPVSRATIDEIVGYRNLAIQKFEDAVAAMDEAIATAAKAAGGTGFFIDRSTAEELFSSYDKGHEKFLKRMRESTDRTVWGHLINGYGFERLMDRKAANDFRQGLERDPPEVTVEIAEATLAQLLIDSDMIFRRGIANAFASLDRRFRSHDGFKIGDRVVLSHAFAEYGGWNSYARQDETIRDIERAFYQLDGKDYPERYAGIIGLVDDERRNGPIGERHAFQVEDEYFRFKAFKNGNAHLWFKRDDLLRKVNRLIGEYYGEVLGAGANAVEPDPFANPNTSLAKNMSWFPTPKKVADRAVGYADVSYSPSRPGYQPPHLRILEPSAGEGAIAKALRALMEKSGASYELDMIELHHGRAQTLRALHFGTVIEADFLQRTPEPIYDRIIMNPPFDRGRDIDHVAHAVRFLAPGGKLIAIMSAGVEFRSDQKSVAFRALVERMNGDYHDVEQGAFLESGTGVNTVIVCLRQSRS